MLYGIALVLRHVAGGQRVIRDEDADVDTAMASAGVGATAVRNIDDDQQMKAARSRRVARPSSATFHTADTGCFGFLLTRSHVIKVNSTSSLLKLLPSLNK